MAGAELRCTQPTRLCSPGTNSSTACIEQKDRFIKSHLQSNVPRCPEQQNSRAPRWHHNLYIQHSLMAEGIPPPRGTAMTTANIRCIQLLPTLLESQVSALCAIPSIISSRMQHCMVHGQVVLQMNAPLHSLFTAHTYRKQQSDT